MRNLKIPAHLDKRKKLTQEQKDEIYRLFHDQGVKKSKLAIEFDVSKKLIGHICHPERAEREKRLRKNRKKADKKRNAAAQARYRERKKQLVLNGKIKIE